MFEVAVDSHFADAWLDDTLGDPPANQRNDDGGGDAEEQVTQRVYGVGAVQQLGGSLGKALQQRIVTGGYHVGSKATGYAGECGGNPHQRVTTGRHKDNRAQRNNQHVARICRHVAEHRHKNQHWRQQALWRDAQHLFQRDVNKAGAFRHAYAQHCHQHDPQRCKAGEGGDHISQRIGQRFRREQVIHHRQHCRQAHHHQ